MKPQKPFDKHADHELVILFLKDNQQVWMAHSSFGPFHFILLLAKKGRVRFRVNGNNIDLYPGKLVLVSRGKSWLLENPSLQTHIGALGFTMQYIEHGVGLLPQSFIRLWDHNVQTIDLEQKEVSWLFLLLKLLRTKVNPQTTSLAHGYILRHGLYMLLWELNDLFRKDSKVAPIKHTAGHILVLHFMHLLAAHSKREHQVGFYAKSLNVTPDHLSRTVKTHTGKTVKGHIREILMEEAKALLQDTAPIKEISQRLGFKTPYGFSRFFKRNASLSPKSYRIKIMTTQ
ncbi:MAG: hypothetical protein CMH46_16670 [Muricauda sp.]|nr:MULTISPECIES: helix-turn-helix transcriptional regulator [unclassified Allomuricauda]MAU17163.1 hypothetical protein [Allomuricauda sp.]